MIFLHVDDNAADRVEELVKDMGARGFLVEVNASHPLHPDAISDWIGSTEDPRVVAVIGATASNRAERRLYEALRRMAKFRGVDVHIAGDTSLESIADKIVKSSDDLKVEAPGSTAGAQIAQLTRSETMSRFQRAQMDIPTVKEVMATTGMPENQARARVEWMKSQEVFVNNLYQVNVEPLSNDMAHIIIRRLDKQPVHNWQHFQQIKNDILGDECEAVEIYPPESKLVDAKHHYHLWGFTKPGRTLGLGFTDRQIADPDK